MSQNLVRLHQQLTRHAEQARSIARTARQVERELPGDVEFSRAVNALVDHAYKAQESAAYVARTWPSPPSPTTELTPCPPKSP